MLNVSNYQAFIAFKSYCIAVILGWVIALSPKTQAAEISDIPVYALTGLEPNIMMVLDDSSSMRFEVLFDFGKQQIFWNFVKQRFELLGEGNLNPDETGDIRLTFPAFKFFGDATYPYMKSYGFTRSPDYNRAYYNPNVTYKPWPTYGGYTPPNGGTQFPNANPAAANVDPLETTTFNLTVNNSYDFFVYAGMVCDDNGNTIQLNVDDNLYCGSTLVNRLNNHPQIDLYDAATYPIGKINQSFFPAIYYRKVTGNPYFFRSSDGTQRECSENNLAYPNTNDLYHLASRNPPQYLTGSIDALAPDGGCLVEVRIAPGNTFPYEQQDVLGNTINKTRSYNEEIQNFANWFTYHRKRSLSLKHALAEAINTQQNQDFKFGMFTINFHNEKNIEFDEMRNFSDNKDFFLQTLYSKRTSGGTPLRTALLEAGNIYSRTTEGRVIQHSCQKNYTVLFADGGNSDESITAPAEIQNADQGKGAPYEDNVSGTLSDIAYYYHHELYKVFEPIDALNDKNVKIPSVCGTALQRPWDNCNNKLHMTTYTIGLGSKGNIYEPDNPKRNSVEAAHLFANEFNWPGAEVHVRTSLAQYDDFWHAAVNGKGKVINAKSTFELENGFRTIFNDILGGEISNSGIAVSDQGIGTLADNERLLFEAKMNIADSSGDLNAFVLNPKSQEKETSYWSAAEKLTNRVIERRIFTLGGNNMGTAFKWENLTAEQKNDLKTNREGIQESDQEGIARLNYIRGARVGEGESGIFRTRKHILGDISSSTPIYSGKPGLGIPDREPFGTAKERYSIFKLTQSKRAGTVFVGANDGMLHAFDALSGEELFAYIPNLLYSSEKEKGLHYLTDKNMQRTSYVDLSPTVYDAYIATTNDTTKKWRSILVGGLRTGGSGIFVLDVTVPHELSKLSDKQAAENLVVWEFKDNNMGTMLQKPFVTMMNNGKWAVIFSSGYSQSPDSEIEGRLYIIYLEKNNGNIEFISIPTNTNGGLSPATLADIDRNGTTDKVYAGDLLGNLWSFDLTSKNDTGWGIANNKPLAKAQNAAGEPQKITAPVAVAANPHGSKNEDGTTPVVVAFGTGKYLAESDILDKSQQSFYLLADTGNPTITRANLENKTFAQPSAERRTISGSTPDFETSLGWFVDFSNPGERLIVQPEFYNETISFFSSVISDDPCSSGGQSWFTTLQINGQSVEENPYQNLPEFDNKDTASVLVGNFIVVGNQSMIAVDGDTGTQVTIGRGNTLENFQAIRDLAIDKNGRRTGWEELIEN